MYDYYGKYQYYSKQYVNYVQQVIYIFTGHTCSAGFMWFPVELLALRIVSQSLADEKE
jgi:hypothetical protein